MVQVGGGELGWLLSRYDAKEEGMVAVVRRLNGYLIGVRAGVSGLVPELRSD
jgi:hypothetical protein